MKKMVGIPKENRKRIVIVGGGFAGLKLAKSLRKTDVQIVLIDKNNYHQFQPLFYQVATSGLEPSAISFPLRKTFQDQKNLHFRIAKLERIDAVQNCIQTDLGVLEYDYLVLAIGADTNYFGNENIRKHAIPMKSTFEAIELRNSILSNFEKALNESDTAETERLLNVVLVGGGPTGVELAGAIAEMKKYMLPKDYPELDFSKMHIYLIEASDKVLNGYSEQSSKKGKAYLERLGVNVLVDTKVNDFDGKTVTFENGKTIATNTMIWAAGIKGNIANGLDPEIVGKGGRLKVNAYNMIQSYSNIFAIGDIALMTNDDYPNGHPQVAQVAIQQAENLAKNMKRLGKSKELKPFSYFDKGSLATVGRNLAVADLPFFSFQGFFAWVLWLFVHLMSIVGVKNRVIIFINWAWKYFTYDQSLRLLIRSDKDIKQTTP